MVTISRKSPLSGAINEMTLDISQEEYDRAHALWSTGGAYIQDAFHMLDADAREFIKTGITPKEWDALFGPEE